MPTNSERTSLRSSIIDLRLTAEAVPYCYEVDALLEATMACLDVYLLHIQIYRSKTSHTIQTSLHL